MEKEYKCVCERIFYKAQSYNSHCAKCKIKKGIEGKTISQSNFISQDRNKIKQCKYCGKEFKISGLGGHVSCCSNNPNREDIIRKRNSIKRKPIPQEIRNKISNSRIKFLKENPDKVPYIINHSSKMSYPEKIFMDALVKENIKGWEYNYRNGIYMYDFAFTEIKLDVEIDGSTHLTDKVKLIDKRRDEFSINKGWRVIRFTAKEINENLLVCINKLKEYL